jgi:hypothetical protein
MSPLDAEDLIDYEDDHDGTNNAAVPLATNGGASGAGEEKDKKNFSGIHSTGFRLDSPCSAIFPFTQPPLQGLLVEA